MLVVSKKEEGVVDIHLLIGSLKTRSGMEPLPRCEPSTYQPISRLHGHHCVIEAGSRSDSKKKILQGFIR